MLPVLRGCELLDLGNSPPPHPSILGRAPRNTTPKKRTLCYRCYFRGLLSGKGGQLIQLKYERKRGRERQRLKKKKKRGEKLLLSSTHTHMRRPSRGESNSMKPFLCHTAAPSKKIRQGRTRWGEAADGEGLQHLFSLCLRASLHFRTLERAKR